MGNIKEGDPLIPPIEIRVEERTEASSTGEGLLDIPLQEAQGQEEERATERLSPQPTNLERDGPMPDIAGEEIPSKEQSKDAARPSDKEDQEKEAPLFEIHGIVKGKEVMVEIPKPTEDMTHSVPPLPEKVTFKRKSRTPITKPIIDLDPGIRLTKKSIQEEDNLLKDTAEQLLSLSTIKPHDNTQGAGTSKKPGSKEMGTTEEINTKEDDEETDTIHHLNRMYSRMHKIYKVAKEKDEEIDSLINSMEGFQVLVGQQSKRIEDLSKRVAIKDSFFEAECLRSKELSERLNTMQQRAIHVEQDKLTAENQTSLMRTALKTANDRKSAAEETLNQLLEDPVMAAPGAMSADEALKKENITLKGQVKAKELQEHANGHVFKQRTRT